MFFPLLYSKWSASPTFFKHPPKYVSIPRLSQLSGRRGSQTLWLNNAFLHGVSRPGVPAAETISSLCHPPLRLKSPPNQPFQVHTPGGCLEGPLSPRNKGHQSLFLSSGGPFQFPEEQLALLSSHTLQSNKAPQERSVPTLPPLLKRKQALISHSASELPATGFPRPPWGLL